MLLSSLILGIAPHLWLDTVSRLLLPIQEPQANGTNHAVSDLLPIAIRNATLDDADDIARTIADAFDPSPAWRYIYQFKDTYPAYHLECLRNRTLEFLQIDQDGVDIIAHVIDAPTDPPRPVAVAVWALVRKGDPFAGAAAAATLSTNHGCDEHLDANTTRQVDFDRQLAAVEKRYLRTPSNDQLYLAMLATHPDWQGRGLGEAHCRWGQRYARGRGVNVTLVATPEGHPVYKTLGWESVENVTITAVDGDAEFWYEGMRWDPEAVEVEDGSNVKSSCH